MTLALQIAAGIVLGVVALVVLYAAGEALLEWCEGSYMRKVRRRNRREARQRAAASGKLEP